VLSNGSARAEQPADNASQYLYERIHDELEAEILSGRYRKGDWFPPERVLKERFNTTHLTVRNALARLVLEGYIERYSGKGTIVIFSHSEAPAAERHRMRLGLAHLIIGRVDEANARLLESLEAGFRKLSVPVLYSCHHGDALVERGAWERAREGDSLVILEPSGPDSWLPLIEGQKRNAVLVNAAAEGFPGPQVLTDHARGAWESVRYLTDLGYAAVAFVSSDLSPAGALIRQGFRKALADLGMAPERGVMENAAPGVTGGEEACKAILGRRADCRAFLCASDESAAGVMEGLSSVGLAPGRDCSVIGWGGTRLAEALGLTTVDPAMEKVGDRILVAVREGLSEGALPQGLFSVAPQLIIRGSCGRAREV
jgi:DNA-binding LacI/PurR family transcriptional regulator